MQKHCHGRTTALLQENKAKDSIDIDHLVYYNVGINNYSIIQTMDNQNKALLIAEQKKPLVEIKTPSKYILERQGTGGKMFKYVETGYVIKMLNEKFSWKGVPLWDFKVIDQQIGTHQIWVKGQLTIHISDAITITKEQFGGVDIKKSRTSGATVSIADDLKASASDALKKCASMVGIASDIYWKGEVTDMATMPQLKKIATMCDIKGYDREELKADYEVMSSKELTLDQAKQIIDMLEALPDKKKEEKV